MDVVSLSLLADIQATTLATSQVRHKWYQNKLNIKLKNYINKCVSSISDPQIQAAQLCKVIDLLGDIKPLWKLSVLRCMDYDTLHVFYRVCFMYSFINDKVFTGIPKEIPGNTDYCRSFATFLGIDPDQYPALKSTFLAKFVRECDSVAIDEIFSWEYYPPALRLMVGQSPGLRTCKLQEKYYDTVSHTVSDASLNLSYVSDMVRVSPDMNHDSSHNKLINTFVSKVIGNLSPSGNTCDILLSFPDIWTMQGGDKILVSGMALTAYVYAKRSGLKKVLVHSAAKKGKGKYIHHSINIEKCTFTQYVQKVFSSGGVPKDKLTNTSDKLVTVAPLGDFNRSFDFRYLELIKATNLDFDTDIQLYLTNHQYILLLNYLTYRYEA